MLFLATSFRGFGKPIYNFLIGLQVDIVPNGCADTNRHPIAHRLYCRVLELEARLEVYVADVQTLPGVQTVLNLLHNADMKKHYATQLQRRERVLGAKDEFFETEMQHLHRFMQTYLSAKH